MSQRKIPQRSKQRPNLPKNQRTLHPLSCLTSNELEPGRERCRETIRVADLKLAKLEDKLAVTYRVNIWFLNCILSGKTPKCGVVSPDSFQYRFLHDKDGVLKFDKKMEDLFRRLDKQDRYWTAFKTDAFTAEMVRCGLELWLSTKEGLCEFIIFLWSLSRFSTPFSNLIKKK